VTNMLLVLPTLTAIISTIVLLFCWFKPVYQRVFNLIGTLVFFIFSLLLFLNVRHLGYLSLNIGGWSAPYGISLCADKLGALMLLLTAIVGLLIAIYSFSDIDQADIHAGFYPAFQVLLVGLAGVFLTADLFNLYVWFEVILISSFILLILRGEKFQLEAGIKYAVLNLVATLFLLTAIAFLYAQTGTLNMADLSVRIASNMHPGFIRVISVFFVIAFGMKAAVFPLYFWLPASYHTARHGVTALFAALLSKVGIYALLRSFTLLFPSSFSLSHELLLILGLLGLILGLMGAIAQTRYRKVLAFLLLAHIGFILMGLSLMNRWAITGSVYYMMQHILLIAMLFMMAGLIKRYRQTGISLFRTRPGLSALFFIAALALSGVPPFSGFWPKLALINGAISAGFAWLSLVFLSSGLVTLYVMCRLWNNVFLREVKYVEASSLISPQAMWASVLMCFTLVLILSLDPAPFYHFSAQIAGQLLHPQGYIHQLLGGAND